MKKSYHKRRIRSQSFFCLAQSFARIHSVYHRMTAEAQVYPEPKAVRATRWPFRMRPSLTASSRAMGMDAAVVFP